MSLARRRARPCEGKVAKRSSLIQETDRCSVPRMFAASHAELSSVVLPRRLVIWRRRVRFPQPLKALLCGPARCAASSKEQEKQEQDKEAAAAPPNGSALYAAADSFRLGSSEFREFGCFHGFVSYVLKSRHGLVAVRLTEKPVFRGCRVKVLLSILR